MSNALIANERGKKIEYILDEQLMKLNVRQVSKIMQCC